MLRQRGTHTRFKQMNQVRDTGYIVSYRLLQNGQKETKTDSVRYQKIITEIIGLR